MDDATLRLCVNQLLKQAGETGISAAEMHHALAQRWSTDYDRSEEEDELAEMIAEHCLEWRAAPKGSREDDHPPAARRDVGQGVPEAPQWWLLQEGRTWARYERERRQMSLLFGLPDRNDQAGIFAVEELKDIFAKIAESERTEGDWQLLEVPTGFDEMLIETDLWPVWRGFHAPPPVGRDGTRRDLTAAERASEQKLYRLAETSQRIADETGCLRGEAVAFLLCGERPPIPYVDVTLDPRYRGYVVIVRDRRIPVRDVAAHYRAHRDLYGPLSRQPQEGPYLVVQFVEDAWAAAPSLSWPELYERFSATHPGRYGSMASFRQTFYTKRPSK